MAYRQLPGQASEPPDRLGAIEPVEEHVKGTVFPYRGMENHGVQPLDVDYDTQKYAVDEREFDEHPEYLSEDVVAEPIPVRVVQEFAHVRKEIRTRQMPVTDVIQIVNRNDARSRIWIKNIGGTNAVFIGNDNNVSAVTGFKLSAGDVLEGVVTTEDIYATTGDGSTTTVAILEEVEVNI
jgi:hypothetical protein